MLAIAVCVCVCIRPFRLNLRFGFVFAFAFVRLFVFVGVLVLAVTLHYNSSHHVTSNDHILLYYITLRNINYTTWYCTALLHITFYIVLHTTLQLLVAVLACLFIQLTFRMFALQRRKVVQPSKERPLVLEYQRHSLWFGSHLIP